MSVARSILFVCALIISLPKPTEAETSTTFENETLFGGDFANFQGRRGVCDPLPEDCTRYLPSPTGYCYEILTCLRENGPH